MTASSQTPDGAEILPPPVRPGPAQTEDPERAAYRLASAVAFNLVEQLPTLPRSVAVVGDLLGFIVRLNFGTNDATGVMEFAAHAGVEAVSSISGHGRWLEAQALVNDVPVRAEVLLSREAAGAFEQGAEAPHPHPTPDAPVDQADELEARYGPGASDEYALQVAEAAEAAVEDERGAVELADEDRTGGAL
ncbi:hypothetical protein ACFY3G_17700 [Streptomyces phaeochromogenes]|uniref:hypothetical protein n=1 Tax=Streptomyces phaeochromogenes TaxID=1923 RepID=UPI00368F691B